MTLPVLWTFTKGNDEYVEWGPIIDGRTGITLGDGTVVPAIYLNSLNGTMTLYDPTGIAVPGAAALAFVYVASSNGIYRALVTAASFNPPVTGRGFKLIVDFNSPLGHWEVPARVITRSTT
jgi:hypothetical protein